jgi:hypothetical protein
MANLTLRQAKGSPLTFAEVDGNFTALNDELATATSANTPDAPVKRDASGNFSAGTITANLTGTASAIADNTVTSAKIVDGSIVDADINSSAAITLTKLGTGALPTAITVASANIVDGTIVNADINASAAIAGTKISPDFGSQNIVTAGDVQTGSINGGPLAGFRNAIINGNFDIWQRGTSTTSGYGADRWFITGLGSTGTFSRQSFTIGQTDVPGEPMFFARTAVTSSAGSGNFFRLIQRIEGVRTFAGQQVTVSFWAKADSTKNIAIELTQDVGTGGSPSGGQTAIGVLKVGLTTSWQKFTRTVTLPSISGVTLGTDGNSFVQFAFWFDAGSSFNARTDTLGQQSGTFDIAQVQIEAGPVATPFERRPIGTELALCQRYYQQYTANGSASWFDNSGRFYFNFLQTMRGEPSISLTATGDIAGIVALTGGTFGSVTSSSARYTQAFTLSNHLGNACFAPVALSAEL